MTPKAKTYLEETGEIGSSELHAETALFYDVIFDANDSYPEQLPWSNSLLKWVASVPVHTDAEMRQDKLKAPPCLHLFGLFSPRIVNERLLVTHREPVSLFTFSLRGYLQ